MTLDIDDVIGRIHLALREATGADLPLLSRCGEAKARAVAHYADLIAGAYAAGALDDTEMAREIAEIEHMTRRMARTLKGLAGTTTERASRAAVSVVLGAMRASLSFAGSPLPARLMASAA